MTHTPSRYLPLLRAAFAVVATVGALSASAATVRFDLNIVSGSNPGGTPPFASAEFTDIGNNAVQIALSVGPDVFPRAFLSDFYLNFGPNTGNVLDPALLDIAYNETLSKGPKPTEIGQEAPNAYKPGGSGLFDLRISFETSAAPPDRRFGPGEVVVFDVTSEKVEFDALSFYFGSCVDKSIESCKTAASNEPSYGARAHLQGLDGGGSAFISAAAPIPVPAAVWLLGSGLLALAGVARRRKAL